MSVVAAYARSVPDTVQPRLKPIQHAVKSIAIADGPGTDGTERGRPGHTAPRTEMQQPLSIAYLSTGSSILDNTSRRRSDCWRGHVTEQVSPRPDMAQHTPAAKSNEISPTSVQSVPGNRCYAFDSGASRTPDLLQLPR
eukprot:3940906-Rhodomonas_salina.3